MKFLTEFWKWLWKRWANQTPTRSKSKNFDVQIFIKHLQIDFGWEIWTLITYQQHFSIRSLQQKYNLKYCWFFAVTCTFSPTKSWDLKVTFSVSPFIFHPHLFGNSNSVFFSSNNTDRTLPMFRCWRVKFATNDELF